MKVLLFLLFGFTQVWATTFQDLLNTIQAYSRDYEQAMLDLKEALADGNKTQQLAHLQLAIQKTEAIITAMEGSPDVINPAEIMVKGCINQRKLLLANLKKAEAIYQNDLKTQSQKIAATKQANTTYAGVQKKHARRRAADGETSLLIEQVTPNSGFEYSGKEVTFRAKVYGDPAQIAQPVDVIVNNPASGSGYSALQPLAQPIPVDLATGGKFKITMGSNLGGGRMIIRAGGQEKSTRLVLNRGEKPVFSAFSGPFDGTYSGGYTGVVVITVDGEVSTEPANGSTGCTIFRTNITVTAPAAGKGRIAANGAANFTAGGGSLSYDGAKVSFMGTLERVRSGAVSAKGYWSSRYSADGVVARGSGSWTSSRPPVP